MAMTVNYSYSNYFSSIGKPLVGAYIFISGLIINIVLNLVLIPKIGISGAAISSSITYVCVTIGFAIKIIKLENLPIREFMIPKLSDYLYVKVKITDFLKGR
jgi:O-antigen/teichoic acid export membrane protein